MRRADQPDKEISATLQEPPVHAPLRVLHVYRTYFPDTQGGLEEVIRQICVNTLAHGVDSRVLTLSRDAEPATLQRPEALVVRCKQSFEVASSGFSAAAFRAFREHAAWADIIHYHYPWPFADMLHLCTRATARTIVTYHSDIVRQRLLKRMYAPLMHRFLSSVDRIVATSPNYFATSEVLARYAPKVEVIPIGLNEDHMPPVSDELIRRSLQNHGRDYFVFVGVLRYYKGLHILLEAAVNAPYRIVIAGSGPIEAELRKQAQRLKLENVDFTGYVTDEEKAALLANARAVVFPSYLRAEAFGVTLLEGSMLGKPLISTEVGSGTSHVNVDGKTGLVVVPGSARALREAMDRLHSVPDLANHMGRNARQRFLDLFSGALMGERYAAAYERLLDHSDKSLAEPSRQRAHSR